MQGSHKDHSGPILFFYINDVANNTESTIKLLADDTSMLLVLKDYIHRGEIFISDLKKIGECAKSWKVDFKRPRQNC